MGLSRVPGGSSGGSAAAVAANLTPIAQLLTQVDQLESLLHFVVLLVLNQLMVSIKMGNGCICISLDQAGIMANSSEDAALVLRT